jgi:hypothetical protein
MKYVGNALNFRVMVEDDLGFRKRLPHHVVNSPCGFAWGYHGSGPADLARDLFAHVVDDDPSEIEPFAIRLFLDEVVARLDMRSDFELSREELLAWVDGKEAEYGDAAGD